MSYRYVMASGDLVLQRQASWLFGRWHNWRNLDGEVRSLKKHLKAAEDHYHTLLYMNAVAEGNVRDWKEMLQVQLMDNSEAAIPVKFDTSILERRDGVKYNFGKGKGNGGDNQNNQKQKQNQQNQQKGGDKSSGKGRNQPMTLGQALGMKVIPTMH